MTPNSDLNGQPGFLEKGFVIIALLFFADAFISLFELEAGIEVIPGERDPFVLYISFPIYIVTALLIMKYRHTEVIVLKLKKEKFLACLIGIAFLSALWSDYPLITLRRSVGLTGTTLFGIYLAVRYSLEEQLKLLASMLGIAAIASLLFAVLLPSYGISTEHEGAWRGIFVHKNVLGRIMVLSSIVFVLLNVHSGKYRLVKWVFLGLFLSLLVLSTSQTSLFVFLILLALLPFYKSMQWHFYLRIFMYCFFVLAVIGTGMWLLDNIKFALNVIGRDITLTGRTDLWEVVIIMIRKRPFLGYGYNAFWRGLEGKESAYVWNFVGWTISHAHNGFLDLWLNLGLPGVAIFILGLFQAVRNSVSLICSINSREALWPLVYITFIFLFNMTESHLVKNNSILWVLYVSVIISLYSANSKKIIFNNYKEVDLF